MIFQLFADILCVHELPIYVQTFDPDTHAAATAGWPQLSKIAGCFNLQSHEDAALWFLLVRVRDHVLAERRTADQRAMVFVDEGLKKAGSCVEVDALADTFLDGHLLFASSSSIALLQLADYAAFSLNRTQISIRRDKRSEFDIALLRILQPLAAHYRNCTRKLGWPDNPGPMVS